MKYTSAIKARLGMYCYGYPFHKEISVESCVCREEWNIIYAPLAQSIGFISQRLSVRTRH
jgi:hypothetical protein